MFECESTAKVRRKERKISQAKNKRKWSTHCKSVAEVRDVHRKVLCDYLNFYGKCCYTKIIEELTLDILSVL